MKYVTIRTMINIDDVGSDVGSDVGNDVGSDVGSGVESGNETSPQEAIIYFWGLAEFKHLSILTY